MADVTDPVSPPGLCGTYLYMITDDSDVDMATVLPFSYDNVNLKFKVSTSDFADIGTYNLRAKVQYKDWVNVASPWFVKDFVVTIEECTPQLAPLTVPATITPSAGLSNIDYVIGPTTV